MEIHKQDMIVHQQLRLEETLLAIVKWDRLNAR